MTPQHYAKLSAQIARQTPELVDYDAQVVDANIKHLNAQPAIDTAQTARDAAQAALTAAQSVEGADTTTEQAALSEADTALQAAKAAQAVHTSARDALQKQADAIAASIAQCQSEVDASGLSLSQAEVDAILTAPVIPRAVTMRQARLALLGAGVLAAVDAAIAGMPEPTRSAAKIEWDYSQEVQRHNGFVAALGPSLGLSPAQIDALFVAAANL